MSHSKRSVQSAAHKLMRISAALCALWMLFLVPLAFRNFFFDINRYKVELVLKAAPVLFIITALAWGYAYSRKVPTTIPGGIRGVLIAIGMFAAACVVSGAMRGFEPAVLDGSEGRRSGMLFLLCCVASFYVIVLGNLSGKWISRLAAASAALVALIGIAHVNYIDPLGFYLRMKEEQIHQFISTIGNVDFYGSYLALMLPLSGGLFLFSKEKGERIFFLICSMAVMLGVPAARSESAYFTMHLGLMGLLAFSGNAYSTMSRALLLGALGWAVLPLLRFMLLEGVWGYDLTGILRWLCESHTAWAMCSVFSVLAFVCYLLHVRQIKPIGCRRFVQLSLAVARLCAAALLVIIAYFSLIDTQRDLGELAQVLRFDDHWGTRRGFAYRCALNALSDYTLPELLFGKGVDLTRRILTPYFDKPNMLIYGVFNDVHCQPLQFLLTIGLWGAASLIACYVMLLRLLYPYAEKDALPAACICSLIAYFPIALLHAAQPILLITVFSIGALGASRVMYLAHEEGEL